MLSAARARAVGAARRARRLTRPVPRWTSAAWQTPGTRHALRGLLREPRGRVARASPRRVRVQLSGDSAARARGGARRPNPHALVKPTVGTRLHVALLRRRTRQEVGQRLKRQASGVERGRVGRHRGEKRCFCLGLRRQTLRCVLAACRPSKTRVSSQLCARQAEIHHAIWSTLSLLRR